MRASSLVLPPLLALFAAACDSAGPSTEAIPYEPQCEAPTAVPCPTELGENLPLHDTVAAGTVSSAVEDNDWVVDVDATAGGFLEAENNPWLYLRFTDEGAQKVEISDTASLDSMDWHLAFHRFRLRLNSGPGGPSCVSAASFPDRAYADLTVDDAASGTFEQDGFFDATCAFVADAEDPEAPDGIPVTALSEWWTYPDCVATTGIPFLIRLDTGRMLKLEILRYYSLGQEACNTEGTMGSGSGEMQIKWAFVH